MQLHIIVNKHGSSDEIQNVAIKSLRKSHIDYSHFKTDNGN